MENKNTLRLAETAIMLGLATVLSLIKFTDLPFGGSVTLFSMLPVILICYRYGFKWGLLSGVTYGILQLVTGLQALRGVSVATFIGAIVLDYLLAFGMCALAGLFRPVKSQKLGLPLGALAACAGRLLCHFLSGVLLWGEYANIQPVWLYSLGYNASYMIPEAILSVVGVLLLSLMLDFRSENITRKAAY